MSCAAPDPAAKAAPPAAQSPAHTPALDPASGRYLHGAAWSALNVVAGALLPLGIFVVFARWLPAAEIGVVALAVAASEVIKACGLPGLYGGHSVGCHTDNAKLEPSANTWVMW